MEPPSLQALVDLLPFAGTLGMELLEADPDQVRGRVAGSPELTTTGEVPQVFA